MYRNMAIIRSGVSPYVSTIILTIIVLGMGSFIYMKMLTILDSRYRELEQKIIRAEIEFRKKASIVAAFIDDHGYLKVFLAVGSYPIKLLALYVNNTLYPLNDCVVYFNNTKKILSLKPIVPPFALAIVVCNASDWVSADVKIVHDGGEVETYVQRIG